MIVTDDGIIRGPFDLYALESPGRLSNSLAFGAVLSTTVWSPRYAVRVVIKLDFSAERGWCVHLIACGCENRRELYE